MSQGNAQCPGELASGCEAGRLPAQSLRRPLLWCWRPYLLNVLEALCLVGHKNASR